MKLVVAMSGGVDSSVVAGLMAEAGHEVVGVTLQLYDHGAAISRKGACCAGQDIHDARRVADTLGIAHYVIDMEARFREAVIDDFADAYARGETPLPCARCNATVKFADLLGIAQDLGADALATGHYVRRVEAASGPQLHVAADPQRDQSYFLYALTDAQLAYCRFPLGGMPTKDQVRAEAARLGIQVASKPDSQDLCFVPQGKYADLVGRLRPEAMAPGEIVDEAGTVLGRHEGIAHYTVGQGKGLGPASMVGGLRMRVLRLDAARRRVVVGPARDAGGMTVMLRDVNWLGGAEAVDCNVKLRAREVPHPARLTPLPGGGAEVVLEQPALAAPGQACVFYDGTRVLGGGTITGRIAEPARSNAA